MEWSLSKSREYLGADDPQTKLLLGKELPEGLAARLVGGTKLADPAVRKALWEGGQAAIDASNDPMIVYARSIDANDRALQKRFDAEVDAPADRGPGQARRCPLRCLWRHASIPTRPSRCGSATARSPAGTERGKMVPTRTTLGGTFDRATGADPFDLPPAFVANRAKIDAERHL